jgi:hypothetical protein
MTLAGGETIRLSFAEDRLPFSVTVLSADSVGADVSVNVGGAILPRRIALNSPLKISPYAIYFGGVTAVMPQVNLVRFVVRRDYFAFVPYVFSLLTGLMCSFWFHVLRHSGRADETLFPDSFSVCYCAMQQIFIMRPSSHGYFARML